MSTGVKTTYTGEIKEFLSGLKEKKCCKAADEYGKRFVSENLGYKVGWIKETATITVDKEVE